MKTITQKINLYNFEELNSDAQQVAKSKVAEYVGIDWIVDDCFLIELPQAIIDKVSKKHDKVRKFYENTTEPLLWNNRNLRFDLLNRYVDISKAMEVKDMEVFLLFADVKMNNENPYLNIANIDLKDGSVIFDSYAQTDAEEEEQIRIEKKIEELLESVKYYTLKSLDASYEYMYSDEFITDTAEANGIMFYENGAIYFVY